MPSNNNQSSFIGESNLPAVFGLPFRPLFLAGSLFSVIIISWWTYYWSSPFEWLPYGGLTWWHAHEMLFGFGIAIITGFLLTAVRTWTGVQGLSGWKLIGLFTLWLTARVLLSFNLTINDWAIALIDVSYLLVAAVAMAYPVIKVKQWRNIMFVPILLILASLNFTSHWAVQTQQYELGIRSFHATIMLFSLLIVIIGGRVIPMFTANGAGCKKAQSVLVLELLSIIPVVALTVVAFYGFSKVPSVLLSLLLMVAFVFNFIRFARWGIMATFKYPLLWSLHLSYLFIPLGFLVLLLNSAGLLENLSAGLHCLTIGATGGMILSMISRVSLGHTGRPLTPHWIMRIGYASILISAIARFIFPVWIPEAYITGIGISGLFWIVSFSLFVVVYSPILLKTRADNKPG